MNVTIYANWHLVDSLDPHLEVEPIHGDIMMNQGDDLLQNADNTLIR